MRRRSALPVACVSLVAASLALAGCSGSSGGSKRSATGGPASAGALPKVSGGFGTKPTITFPAGGPPAQLTKEVLHQGTGKPAAKGDLLVADYTGEIWRGKVFDSSFSRPAPAGFPIGVGQVIPGWDKELVGVPVGSRVLLSIPPADGYGSSGNAQAGIKGSDTLVFVVDVVDALGKTQGGSASAAPEPVPANVARVGGPLGGRPTVTVPPGTPVPAKPSLTLVAKGTGPAVTDGPVYVQFEAVDWKGSPQGSTWQSSGPQQATVGGGGPFDLLKGVPVGSRVLLELPPQQQAGKPAPNPATDSIAAVIDVVAQPHRA